MRKTVENVLILALTLALVVGAFASFQRKRSSFERIDFTFMRRNGVILVRNVDADSNAQRAGLRPGDEIWVIADTPSNEVEGLQKTLRRIGAPVPMIVQRGGHALKLTYQVPELKIDYSYLILSFIGFLYLAIGLFTLFRGDRRESTMFYFVTLLSFVVYVYTPAGDIDFTYKLLQLVEEFATILLPPLTLNFFLQFPRPILRHKGLIAALYLPPALLALWDIDLLIFIVPYLVVGSVKPIYSTISILPLALIPLAFAVSILKYKLWDVEVVIKETLAYSVTFAFGMIAFSTVNMVLSHMIEEGSALERNFLAFTSGLLIAGVLIPVKGRIESVIEMLVYRDSYRHRRAMSDFAQELATFRDVHELISMMRERMRAALDIEKMNLFTREGRSLAIYENEDVLPRRVTIADFGAMPASGPMMLAEPRLPDKTDLPWQLLRAGYRYVLPLPNRGDLQGVLLLGTKRGEEPLSRDDLHLLESLAAPLALAIENSRLYGRLRRQLDEIRSLKEYNENIIESSSSAIAVVASDGTILTANH